MSGTLRDHQRAELAHAHVQKIIDQSDVDAWKKYRSIALKLPVLVHQAGLAAALHFVAARAEKQQRVILVHLAEQLHNSGHITSADRQTLLAATRDPEFARAQALSRETLRCLLWYKRMVQAQIDQQVDPNTQAEPEVRANAQSR